MTEAELLLLPRRTNRLRDESDRGDEEPLVVLLRLLLAFEFDDWYFNLIFVNVSPEPSVVFTRSAEIVNGNREIRLS